MYSLVILPTTDKWCVQIHFDWFILVPFSRKYIQFWKVVLFDVEWLEIGMFFSLDARIFIHYKTNCNLYSFISGLANWSTLEWSNWWGGSSFQMIKMTTEWSFNPYLISIPLMLKQLNIGWLNKQIDIRKKNLPQDLTESNGWGRCTNRNRGTDCWDR